MPSLLYRARIISLRTEEGEKGRPGNTNAFHEFFIGHANRIPTTVHAVISTGNFHGPTDIILIVISSSM